MANSNAELATKLSNAGASMVPAALEGQVREWYRFNRKKLISMAGDEETVALHIAGFYTQVNKVPALIQCKPDTLFLALMYSIGTKLLCGAMAEAYILPFKGEATFIPSYQGLMKLAYNSGWVTRITGHVVREKDDFTYNMATEEISHSVNGMNTKERGKRIGAYVVVKNVHGEILPVYKDAEFIEGIKKRSPAAGSKFSPWNSSHESDVDAMWLKTVVRQAAKWIPKSSTPQGLAFGKALELDATDGGLIEVEDAMLIDDEVANVKQTVMELDK